jgi:hypothetical protein
VTLTPVPSVMTPIFVALVDALERMLRSQLATWSVA